MWIVMGILITSLSVGKEIRNTRVCSNLLLAVTLHGNASSAKPPAVVARFVNNGGDFCRLNRTFGFSERYVYLEIKREESDVRVPYPWTPQVKPRSISLDCIPPGAEAVMYIDLHSWRANFGGTEGAGPFGFSLPPGNYQARVVYEPGDTRPTIWCPKIAGRLESEWILFEIKEPEPKVLEENNRNFSRN